MKCVYCGKDKPGSREHIISSAVLDLFPECFATIDGERGRVYPSDPVIKDVCAECNSKIAYIDSYAKAVIEEYFVQKYEKDSELQFKYDYTMLQKVCVKYAFNDCRSRGYDRSFFAQDIVQWLLNKEDDAPKRNITLMAGLAINTSPAPDFVFGNNKIRWGKDPLLFSNSIVMNVDYNTGQIFLRENPERESFTKEALSYIFRFNSLQIILMCWEPDISDEELQTNNVVLGVQYSYTILDDSGKSVLKRCTSESTYHIEKLIDTTWGQDVMDEISYMRGTFSDESQNYLKAVEQQWEKEEERIANEHPRHN